MDISNKIEFNTAFGQFASAKAERFSDLQKSSGKLSAKESARYEKAARGFEAMMLHMMLKEMKSAMLEEKSSQETFGANTLMSHSDMLFAEEMSQTGSGIGLAEMIFKNLTGQELPNITKFNPNQPKPTKAVEINQFFPQVPGIPASPVNYESKIDKRFAPISRIIDQAAEKFDLPQNLIKAVIEVESAGKTDAVSPAGAKGLMQLMDSTARELGVSNPFDPEQNIFGGAKYLRQMIDKFGQDDLALAAYNAGPGNVQKYGGIPPFEETQNYVQKVKLKLNNYQNRGR